MRVTRFPKIIEFQTHNRCNANCIICPYSSMSYKSEKMEDEIFKKIIDECVDKRITRLIPYLNNEPFLDKTFIQKLSYIRKKLPQVEIEISTNVSFLNENLIIELSKLNITELRLSMFGFTYRMHHIMMPGVDHKKVFENAELIAKYLGNTECKVSIVMIDNKKIPESEFVEMKKFAQKNGFDFCRWGFLDRAKNVKKFSNNYYDDTASGCEQRRPIERMHILADGKVIFCCQDWAHENIMGNIGTDTIESIWVSERYNDYRKCLYSATLDAPEICKRCVLSESCGINGKICN
ncbi:radical SAM/SPASM domain-containing protein [Streptococcus intermedius]|uniref:radical SAM/SPASM domain-containing protein n=1 Tax=Streptococcus intermedius TaxID=1338 RepID=UPI0024952382|nr:radical SAM/SPASM domain-containing protein [Streptococcus intermedius]